MASKPVKSSSSSLGGTVFLAAALSAIVAALYLAQDLEPLTQITSDFFPANKPLLAKAPAQIWHQEKQEYAFGRWKSAIKDIRFHYEGESLWHHVPARFQTKRWHYTSVNTPHHFIAIALMSMQYLGPVFVYVVDKTTLEKWETGVMSPLAWGVSFSASSVDPNSCSSYTGYNLSLCYQDDSWHMKLDSIPLTSEHSKETLPFSFDLKMASREALILSFPLANNPLRPAYVHKGAGYPVSGEFTLGTKRVVVDVGLGAIDWTKSIALHRTEWYWASSNFYSPDGKAVGINLSRRVYDVNGASQENAIWIDGTVCVLGEVKFNIPEKNPNEAKWTIESRQATDKDALYLEFVPAGSRAENVNILNVLTTEFVQPYGHFSGHVKCTAEGKTYDINVQDAFGVVEDHVSLW
ncbi:unnamed protein product [Aphanomyces euteiches]